MWKCAKITILAAVYAFTFGRVYSQSGSSCVTPNDESAQCISIYSCTILYNAVTTRNSQQLSFLRESQCGYENDPLVCCGSDDNYRSRPKPLRRNRPRTTTEESTIWDGSQENRASTSNVLPKRDACGIQDADRILDGQVTSLTEFPWMALLQYRRRAGNLVFSCGGTLISSRYVLTAAHCVKGQIITKIGPLVNVRLGEYNTDTEEDCTNQLGFEICNDRPQDRSVEEVIVHPDYDDTSLNRYHDIALIRLSSEVPNTQFIKPICLPGSSDRVSVGSRAVVAGWGRTEYANSSPVKLKLRVPVVSSSQCSGKFRTAGVTVGNKQLCAGGERGRDSCNGDSGGPLMGTTSNDSAQWYIEGIVSFGARCGSDGWPGIYTKVSEYTDWISENVR